MMTQAEAEALVYAGAYICIRGGNARTRAIEDAEVLKNLEDRLGSSPKDFPWPEKGAARQALAVICAYLSECAFGGLGDEHDVQTIERVREYLLDVTPDEIAALAYAALTLANEERRSTNRMEWVDCYRAWMATYGIADE